MRRLLCSISVLVVIATFGLSGVASAAETDAGAPEGSGSAPFDPGVDPQIVGGAPQTITNFPWMAALLLTDRPEVQHIVVNATGGTFTVTWNGQTTASLAFNISGAAFTTAMENLSNVAPGDVVVTGGPGDAGGNTPYVLTWAVTLGDVAQPTTNATNLTGGAGTATPSTVTSGLNNPFQEQFCGGSLIDARYILTAAHCITNFALDPGAPDINVVLGETDLDAIVPGDRRTISAITFAPGYDQDTHEHDLAILTLTLPATGIPTVAYATNTTTEGLNQPAIILGWGAVDFGPNSFSSILQGAAVKVLAAPGNTTCGTIPGTPGPGQVFFPASHICAGQTQQGGTPDNCVFDDGGPLAVGNPGGWKLIGVTTDLGPCGEDDPSLYARISDRSSWIDSVLVPTPSTNNGTYHAIEPFRLLDTRFTTGLLAAGYVGPQSTINPQVNGWNPITSPQLPLTGVNAVVVNVAVTSPSKAGWLTLYPTGSALPTAANLNFVAGQTVPNLATVQIGQGGKFSVSNTVGNPNAGSTHIIIDMVGWYGDDATGALFHSMAPARIMDTRFGNADNAAGKITQASPRTTNVCDGLVTAPDIPDDATAVAVNASVVAGSTAGWLTMWPEGTAPTVSNLNYTAGIQIANLAIVKVNLPECTIRVGNSTGSPGSHAPVDVILDAVGWYGPDNTPSDPGGSAFHSMVPNRIVDTRPGNATTANPGVTGIVGPLATIDVRACDTPGTNVPDTAVAVVLNLVATGPTKSGWLTLYPGSPATLPEASNLLFAAGQTVPNLAIMEVEPTTCEVQVDNSKSPSSVNPNPGSTHVVIDVMGWFE